MDQPPPILVRGRCACGKRYRIRNARPGITVMCPNCRRPIPITDADLRAALADARLIPVQSETVDLQEVIPVDHGELTLAPEGSRPGLTGEKALAHEEVMLASAVRRRFALSPTDEQGPPPVGDSGPRVLVEFEPVQRGFVHDLFASFYCAGVARNALDILVIATACSLMVALQYVLASFPILLFFMIPIYGIVFLYAIQFYWTVLRNTAAGEDGIPWAQTHWSFWHDGFKPLIWMAVISGFCSLPAVLLAWYGLPGIAVGSPAWWLVLGVGWFFWPVAVMSVALGNTITFVRPDWLVRCAIGIGPVYVVAWVPVMIAVAGWYVFWQFANIWLWIPVIGFAVNLYFGYVVFRTLGLLFRHFRERFPWKY
jgi:hypothetical protein